MKNVIKIEGDWHSFFVYFIFTIFTIIIFWWEDA